MNAATPGLPETIIFVILAASTVAFALLTITSRNPVSSVMALVATFFSLAAIYATLQAHFLAVLQILVYAGAIMVLFIFVVMILNREEISRVSFRGIVTRAVGVLAAGYVILYLAGWVVWRERASALLAGTGENTPADFGTVAGVGASLFRDFVFPFEAISLLLLVAIVGGVIVSRSQKQEDLAEEHVQKLRDIRNMGQTESRMISGPGANQDPHAPHGGAHH